MFREPVSSSMIAAIGYDEEAEMLEVEFVSGAVYRYRSVNQDAFEDFRAAPVLQPAYQRRLSLG